MDHEQDSMKNAVGLSAKYFFSFNSYGQHSGEKTFFSVNEEEKQAYSLWNELEENSWRVIQNSNYTKLVFCILGSPFVNCLNIVQSKNDIKHWMTTHTSSEGD